MTLRQYGYVGQAAGCIPFLPKQVELSLLVPSTGFVFYLSFLQDDSVMISFLTVGVL